MRSTLDYLKKSITDLDKRAKAKQVQLVRLTNSILEGGSLKYEQFVSLLVSIHGFPTAWLTIWLTRQYFLLSVLPVCPSIIFMHIHSVSTK